MKLLELIVNDKPLPSLQISALIESLILKIQPK